MSLDTLKSIALVLYEKYGTKHPILTEAVFQVAVLTIAFTLIHFGFIYLKSETAVRGDLKVQSSHSAGTIQSSGDKNINVNTNSGTIENNK